MFLCFVYSNSVDLSLFHLFINLQFQDFDAVVVTVVVVVDLEMLQEAQTHSLNQHSTLVGIRNLLMNPKLEFKRSV